MHIYGDHADNLELPTYASTEQTDDTYTKAPTVRIKVGIKHVSNLCDLHSPDKKQNDNNQRGPKRRDFPESEITQIENVCETTAETPNTLLENYDNNGYDVRFDIKMTTETSTLAGTALSESTTALPIPNDTTKNCQVSTQNESGLRTKVVHLQNLMIISKRHCDIPETIRCSLAQYLDLTNDNMIVTSINGKPPSINTSTIKSGDTILLEGGTNTNTNASFISNNIDIYFRSQVVPDNCTGTVNVTNNVTNDSNLSKNNINHQMLV